MSEELQQPSIPPPLYHYTSQAGLLGILEKRGVQATSICYMNDGREFNYARQMLHEAVMSFRCSDAENFADLLPFMRPPTWDVYPDVFVFCMSQHADDLGQWRAYAGGVSGYAIGFITQTLIATAVEAGFRLVHCEYIKEMQHRLIHQLLEETRSWANSMAKEKFSFFRHSILRRFWEAFAITAAQIKHPSFAMEDEWRLVSDGIAVPKPLDNKPLGESKYLVLEPRSVSVRVGRSTLAPYVDIKLSGEDGKLPLYHLIVGPTIDRERAVNAAQIALTTNRQAALKGVRASIVPYRSW